MSLWLNTGLLAVVFLLLFASAEWLYHWRKWQAEHTRKYVHIVTGLLTMLFPPMLGDPLAVGLLCGSFLLILLSSLYFKLLPSINAVDRLTRGSLLYPIVVFGCYLLFHRYGQYLYFYLPILILAFSDPLAALTGKRWPMLPYRVFGKHKTVSGSLAFFVSAFIISLTLFLLEAADKPVLLPAILVAITTTLAEAVIHRGYDNLSIPAAAALVLLIQGEFLFF